MPRWNPPKLDANGLWEYAVKILAGRAYSSGELRGKLQRKADKQSDIEPLLARLKEYRYLDDKKYAETFATARLENQMFGRNRVLRDLRERRIAPTVAERTVEKVYQEVDETALFQEDKDLASAYRKLLRAGFSSGNIVSALKRFARNPDLLDQWEPPEEIEEESS